MIDYVGWAATAVFVSSYFFDRVGVLRAVQVGGAIMWIVYGVLLGALPVVAANVLVFAAAACMGIDSQSAQHSAPRDELSIRLMCADRAEPRRQRLGGMLLTIARRLERWVSIFLLDKLRIHHSPFTDAERSLKVNHTQKGPKQTPASHRRG